jgi:hypothetical protein
MAIYATAGTKVFIGGILDQKSVDFAYADFYSQVWTEITNHESIGGLGDAAQVITQSLIKQARDKTLKGTRQAKTMELVCAADSADLGQVALIAAEKTVFDYAFKLELSDALPAVASTVTMTIAGPGVVTSTAHGRVLGDKVIFTTTGALPTGLVAGTEYFVKAALTADTLTLSATLNGAAITTSGSQSGVHTMTTVPEGSRRLFIGKVLSSDENYDGANSTIKGNYSIAPNSNIVRVARSA